MRTSHAVRGAALPETALVMTATLALVFGVIQIGIIGFLQIMLDGAAFIAAHEYALGNQTTYQTTAALVFPQLGTVYIDTNNPDPTTVNVNYNTNLTLARHGGVSLVRSSHLQATVTQSAPTGLLGVGVAELSGVNVHGAAVEPDNLVSNDAYDANQDGYSGMPSQQLPYYSNVQNAPANYISQHNMVTCTLKPPQHFAATCGNPNLLIRGLGTAEFLDHDNWQRTNLGVGSYAAGYTFGEVLCHQEAFAAVAQTFTPFTTPAQLSNLGTSLQNNLVPAVTQIYSWDTFVGGGYGPGETAYGLYPLHPANGC